MKSLHFGRKFLYFELEQPIFPIRFFKKWLGCPLLANIFSLSLEIVPEVFAKVNSAQFSSLLTNVRRVFGLGSAVGGR